MTRLTVTAPCSARSALIAAVLLAGTACAAVNAPVGKGGPASDVRTPAPSSVPTIGGKGGSPSPIPGVADPSVDCVARPTGAPMVLVGGAIYEVADPVHPRLLCQIKNSAVHLFTADTFEYIRRSGDSGTEVVLHSMGSGNESVVAGWPIKLLNTDFGNLGTWTADGENAATLVRSTDANNNPTLQVWLFAQPNKTMLEEFPFCLADCIVDRFGVPKPTLAFSADGKYLVAGWLNGRGSVPLEVFRIPDGTMVGALDRGYSGALWSRTGHTLYLSRHGDNDVWTLPLESGFTLLAGASEWAYMPGVSPDGSQVAYTAYQGVPETRLGVYVYDFASHQILPLTDEARSQITFVKDGWVWYWEEVPCASCAYGQMTTGDKVFAMEVGTGVEEPVVFAAGESPIALQSGWSAGQFWPNS